MTLLEYMTFMRNVKFNTQFIEIWIDGESEGLPDVSTEVTLFPNPYITEKDFQYVSMKGLSSCEIDSIGDGHWDSQIIYLKHYKELYNKYRTDKKTLKTIFGTIECTTYCPPKEEKK